MLRSSYWHDKRGIRRTKDDSFMMKFQSYVGLCFLSAGSLRRLPAIFQKITCSALNGLWVKIYEGRREKPFRVVDIYEPVNYEESRRKNNLRPNKLNGEQINLGMTLAIQHGSKI